MSVEPMADYEDVYPDDGAVAEIVSGLTPRPGSSLELVAASDVRIERVRWAWENRIPLRAVTLLAGLEGLGKTVLMLWLLAKLTRGTLPGELFGTYHGVFEEASGISDLFRVG